MKYVYTTLNDALSNCGPHDEVVIYPDGGVRILRGAKPDPEQEAKDKEWRRDHCFECGKRHDIRINGIVQRVLNEIGLGIPAVWVNKLADRLREEIEKDLDGQ